MTGAKRFLLWATSARLRDFFFPMLAMKPRDARLSSMSSDCHSLKTWPATGLALSIFFFHPSPIQCQLVRFEPDCKPDQSPKEVTCARWNCRMRPLKWISSCVHLHTQPAQPVWAHPTSFGCLGRLWPQNQGERGLETMGKSCNVYIWGFKLAQRSNVQITLDMWNTVSKLRLSSYFCSSEVPGNI